VPGRTHLVFWRVGIEACTIQRTPVSKSFTTKSATQIMPWGLRIRKGAAGYTRRARLPALAGSGGRAVPFTMSRTVNKTRIADLRPARGLQS
jgi:hypothetical protein